MATSIYGKPSFAAWKASSAAGAARHFADEARQEALRRPDDPEAERAAQIAEAAAEEADDCYRAARLISESPGDERERFLETCRLHSIAYEAMERARLASPRRARDGRP